MARIEFGGLDEYFSTNSKGENLSPIEQIELQQELENDPTPRINKAVHDFDRLAQFLSDTEQFDFPSITLLLKQLIEPCQKLHFFERSESYASGKSVFISVAEVTTINGEIRYDPVLEFASNYSDTIRKAYNSNDFSTLRNFLYDVLKVHLKFLLIQEGKLFLIPTLNGEIIEEYVPRAQEILQARLDNFLKFYHDSLNEMGYILNPFTLSPAVPILVRHVKESEIQYRHQN